MRGLDSESPGQSRGVHSSSDLPDVLFKHSDQSSDFSERLESGEWARECKSFDEFRQAFRRMMKKAEWLGVVITALNQKQVIVEALPEKLRLLVSDRYDADATVDFLLGRIELWRKSTRENPFQAGRVPTRQGFKGVPGGFAPLPFLEPRQIGPCFGCGAEGYLKRDCPKFRNRAKKPDSGQESPRGMNTAGTEEGTAIQWHAGMLCVAGSKELWRPYADVEFTDGSGDGKKLVGVLC